MTPEDKNEIIKEAVVDPDNCHCTNRTLLSENEARAVSKATGKVRAELLWTHKSNGDARMVWQTPLGSTHFRIIHDMEDEDEYREHANERINDGNVEMDANYNEGT